MEITNRTIAILVSVTLVLVVFAVWFTFDPRPAEVVTSTYFRPPPADTGPRPVIPIVKREGKQEVKPTGGLDVRKTGKDGADTVMLACGGEVDAPVFRAQQKLKSNRAYFEELSSDGCFLYLQKVVNAAEGEYLAYKPGYSPIYPGDKVSCSVENEATVCTGGLAQKMAGVVNIDSGSPARISVDGVDLGALPVNNHKVRMGRRKLTITYDSGQISKWPLTVGAKERISLFFPKPKGNQGMPPESDAPPE